VWIEEIGDGIRPIIEIAHGTHSIVGGETFVLREPGRLP
jgi:hypothetical protein